jgi:hypothetical protein
MSQKTALPTMKWRRHPKGGWNLMVVGKGRREGAVSAREGFGGCYFWVAWTGAPLTGGLATTVRGAKEAVEKALVGVTAEAPTP